MEPNIRKEDCYGWPTQSRPDRSMPEPWTKEMLVSVPIIHHHKLSPDGRELVFIWQREASSDLWKLALDGFSWPQRLTLDRPIQTVWTDAQPCWSPDGRWLAYDAQEDIWAVPSQGGKARNLTGFKHADTSPIFSPDGQRVYFLSGRKEFNQLCWTTLESDWPVQLTNFEADVSDPQPSPDGRRIAFVYHPQKDLNRTEICIVPAEGGKVQHLTGAEAVMDTHPRWSPDGRQIALLSNRSGWKELYLFEVKNGALVKLTAGQADVTGFAWSHDGKRIALTINRKRVTSLALLKLASGELKEVHSGQGWHSLPQWEPEDRWLTVEFETPVQPPEIYQIVESSGITRKITFSAPPLLANANLIQPEFVQFPSTGGSIIPGFLYRPKNASVDKPCPAVVYPHGGPTDEHANYWELLPQWLVAKGYAILAPNYRGSTGNGLAHQRALHNHWGIVDTEDMLAAADYLVGLDWVDGERLGIYGASYGSYLAVLALARDPQHRFKCGVAKYGDCDILTSWAQGDRPGREDLERQMGHPTTNRSGYQAGSPVYDVDNIQAPLLILHGDQDKRVHPKQSEQLVEALKQAGKTFEYVLYEGDGHGLLQQGNVLHFYATLERFLDWYLL